MKARLTVYTAYYLMLCHSLLCYVMRHGTHCRPLYMNAIILAANVGGIFAGEWNGASAESRKWMGLGLLVLCGAVAIIGYGNAN